MLIVSLTIGIISINGASIERPEPEEAKKEEESSFGSKFSHFLSDVNDGFRNRMKVITDGFENGFKYVKNKFSSSEPENSHEKVANSTINTTIEKKPIVTKVNEETEKKALDDEPTKSNEDRITFKNEDGSIQHEVPESVPVEEAVVTTEAPKSSVTVTENADVAGSTEIVLDDRNALTAPVQCDEGEVKQKDKCVKVSPF